MKKSKKTKFQSMPEAIAVMDTIVVKCIHLVESWQNRSLSSHYAVVYLDALHINLRKDGKIGNVAIYNDPGWSQGDIRALDRRWQRRG